MQTVRHTANLNSAKQNHAILLCLLLVPVSAELLLLTENFIQENKDLQLICPVLILLGDKDKTGKVKQYCTAWAKNTGYPLHIIDNAAHFSNGDNAEQVNVEIEQFIESVK